MTTARHLTTGEAARLCRISHQKIIRLCDAGALPHYRVPFSKFRRIVPADLAEFAAAHGMTHVGPAMRAAGILPPSTTDDTTEDQTHAA